MTWRLARLVKSIVTPRDGSSPARRLVVVGLRSLASAGGRYLAEEILKFDDVGVHARVCSNRFESRPPHVDPGPLCLTSFEDDPAKPRAIGYRPLCHEFPSN